MQPGQDPILDPPPPGPCQGADYAPGIDAQGRPVVPADVGAAPVPVPGQMAVPLRGRPGATPYVSLDGKALDGLVNPKPCH